MLIKTNLDKFLRFYILNVNNLIVLNSKATLSLKDVTKMDLVEQYILNSVFFM